MRHELTLLELLRCVRQKLNDPRSWVKGTYVGKKSSRPNHQRSWYQFWKSKTVPWTEHLSVRSVLDGEESADCYCLMGAARVCAQKSFADPILGQFENLLCDVTGFRDVPYFNDHDDTTHKQVLDVLDAAIARAETEEVYANT